MSQWYRNPDAQCPFVLSGRITFKKLANAAFQSVAAFPWSKESIHMLWEGRQELVPERWDDMIATYTDAIATATESVVMICFLQDKKRCIEFTLPPRLEIAVPIQSDAIRLAWALSPLLPYEPLLVVGRLHTVHILNVSRHGPFAYLVGHGGAITSIAVHPIHPHIIATTSRDFTTRIYDLTLPPRQEEDVEHNPNLLPLNQPSRAGPAFGLNMNEKEGVGMGRCVVLLVGGRSGGHNAAVLGAAFHSTKPLIATCGLDRAVKIWALPPTIKSLQMSRQDKPLFSSTSMHRARALSINWLSDDILLSHSAPTILRTNHENEEQNDVHEYTTEAGELVLWRWLSLNRFFPPELRAYRQPLYPPLSDWKDSNSFQILFKKFIPGIGELSQLVTPTLSMDRLDPDLPTSGSVVLLSYPNSTLFRLLHVPDSFRQREPPKFPLDDPDKNGNLESGVDFISGWLLDVEENSVPKLNACAIIPGGNIIVGVGTQGTLWTWTIR